MTSLLVARKWAVCLSAVSLFVGCATSRPGEVQLRAVESSEPVSNTAVVLRGYALFMPTWPHSQIGSPGETVRGATDGNGSARFARIPFPGVIEVWKNDGESLTGELISSERGPGKWERLTDELGFPSGIEYRLVME